MADGPPASAAERARTAAPPAEAGWILVVDDTELNRDMLSRRLAKQGFRVECAVDGLAALETLEQKPFDLVLLDIMMPGIDGVETLRRIRQTRTPAQLPVIMVTAKDSSDDIVAALRAGANDYVTKPVDFPVCLARTRTHLELRRAQEALRAEMERAQKLAADLEVRNEFIRRVFGRYLTDEVVDELLERPEGLAFGGQRRLVTVLMSDLRGFSALSERHSPEQVVRFLNAYLESMTAIISKHRGTIDEFLGDAILAVFGAPVQRVDDAERAVACAVEMQNAMPEVNRRARELGLPRLEMGIGLHCGEVAVGNIGSTRRAKYGIVGSAVNLAGRVESYTVGGQVLATEALEGRMSGLLEVRGELSMTGKGLRKPVRLLDVAGIGGAHAVRLQEEPDVPARLAAALPVEYVAFRGKHVAGGAVQARITHLSDRSARMEGDFVPQLREDLLLRLPSVPAAAGEDVYAKVVGYEGTGWRARFTSVPPAVAEALEALEALARA